MVGILILTSNRVGTFDEAFKSRIQLNLRYNNLEREQRLQIWRNFVRRLETLESSRKQHPDKQSTPSYGIDFEGIREHLLELTEPVLNGREIRNAISTARQLALFRREPLGYEHIKRVINEADKFEKYINDVHQGFSTDQIQRDKMER